MITTTTETADPVTRQVYTAPLPDTTNITAYVENDVVTISAGSGQLILPLEAIPTLVALAATIGAGIQPVIPVTQ